MDPFSSRIGSESGHGSPDAMRNICLVNASNICDKGIQSQNCGTHKNLEQTATGGEL